jgi:hypothetical protein
MLGQKSKDFRRALSVRTLPSKRTITATIPQETLLELSQKILGVLKDTKAILNFDRYRDAEALLALVSHCATLSDEQIKEEAKQFGKACADKARSALAIDKSSASPVALRSILDMAAKGARAVASTVPRLTGHPTQNDDVVTHNTPNQKQGLIKTGWDAFKRSIVGVG